MKTLIIPQIENIEESLALAARYNAGFEYNDFFQPDVLEDGSIAEKLTAGYKAYKLPEYCTLHGAFFDVIPFSLDKRIREVSDLRIKQSIKCAAEIGARAVVFHTNYNPFLNSLQYAEFSSSQFFIYCGEFKKIRHTGAEYSLHFPVPAYILKICLTPLPFS